MRSPHHITAVLGFAALALAGCASANMMERYVGGPVSVAMLDYGPPDDIFALNDGRRAYQWEIKKEGFRQAPQPTLGVGIGIGTGVWGGRITTVNTAYVPYSKTCRYTLISDQRGQEWFVSEVRKPTPGCA